METLRFLLVTSFYPPFHLGGDAVHVQYLAEALASQGHEVHVEFCPAAYRIKRPFAPMPGDRHSDSVRLHPMGTRTAALTPVAAYSLGRSRAATRFHDNLVQTVRPDVVHLHNISLLGLGVQGAPASAAVLYTTHDSWFRCPRSDLLKNGKAPCEVPTCRSCMIRSRRMPPLWRKTDIGVRLDRVDRVITPSAFMRRQAQDSFRCPVVHIPHFAPDPNPRGDVETGSNYYLYAGVFERPKGVRELAEAAAQYRGDHRFVLVGRGSLERSLRMLAKERASTLEVRPWASREELASLYRHAAAFVMPSICLETASLASIEALSWGSPLLTTSRGGVPELLQDGRAGYSFEPTPAGILSAVDRFEKGGVDRNAFRQAARRAYELNHRPEVYVERYQALVKTLLEGRKSSARPGTSKGLPAEALKTETSTDARHDR